MNRTFAVNFDALTFSETIARSARFTMTTGQSITISKPLASASSGQLLYDAWASSQAVDADWLIEMSIWGRKNGGSFEELFQFGDNDTDSYATESAAYSALAAGFPRTYWFEDYDTIEIRLPQDGGVGSGGSNDNQGGMSFLITVADGVNYYDMIPDMPDAPIKEEWTWITDTQVSYDGTEDPTLIRSIPMRTFSGNISFDSVKELRRYQAAMQKTMRGVFRFPLFQYQVKAKQPVLAFANYIICNTSRGEFRDGGEALIREGDSWELVVIQSVLADRLMLGNTPLNSYSAKALICPVVRVFTATGATMHRVNPDDSGSADYTFREWEAFDPFVNPQSTETLTTFDSLVVLDNRAVGTQFDLTIDTGVIISDDYINQADVFNPWTQSQLTFPLTWQCNRVWDLEAWFWWQEFCDAIQGESTTFLIPSFRTDMEIVTPATGGTNAIVFEGHEFRDHYYGLDTFSRLVIESAARRQFVKVTGISNVGGNDRVTFTPALSAGSWETDQKVGFLLKVRNAGDKVTVDHYGLQSNISMSIRTVK